MKTLILVTTVMLAAVVNSFSQDADIASRVTDDARFELVQVPWDKGTTFRLDKYRGVISRLTTCVRDDTVGSRYCWKEMIIVDPSRGDGAGRPRFQIVVNNGLRRVFLLHVESGQTWEYGVDARQQWHPFVECNERTDATCYWRPVP